MAFNKLTNHSELLRPGYNLAERYNAAVAATGPRPLRTRLSDATTTPPMFGFFATTGKAALGRGCVKNPPSLARFKHQLMGALHEAIRRWS